MLSILLSLVKSKTVQGATLTVVMLALKSMGIDMDTETLQAIVDKGEVFLGILGFFWSVYGRIVAKGPLVPPPNLPLPYSPPPPAVGT